MFLFVRISMLKPPPLVVRFIYDFLTVGNRLNKRGLVSLPNFCRVMKTLLFGDKVMTTFKRIPEWVFVDPYPDFIRYG